MLISVIKSPHEHKQSSLVTLQDLQMFDISESILISTSRMHDLCDREIFITFSERRFWERKYFTTEFDFKFNFSLNEIIFLVFLFFIIANRYLPFEIIDINVG